jgi:hypothetical protein
MASFTFFWNNKTWDFWSKQPKSQIRYVAGHLRRPFSEIQKGDEIFVVRVKDNTLFVGGRLIASGMPVDQASAKQQLDNYDLLDMDGYVIADTNELDFFRPNLKLDANDVRLFEMLGSEGVFFKEFSKTSFSQDFLNTQKITESSAKKLRTLLSISGSDLVSGDAKLEDEINEIMENVDPDEVRSLRAILTRRGQPEFRKKLLSAYSCWRQLNIDPPCQLKFDPGLGVAF